MSAWALREWTDGPFEEFNIFIWIRVLSAFIPISPPNASISLTIIPLAEPPIEGLQGIVAMLLVFPVTNKVLCPILAAAKAASQPACPPPTTIIS